MTNLLWIPQFLALVIAITVHEFSHGLAAYKLGDETALRAGRLTLNPLAHIDPVGTILLPLIGLLAHIPMIGWAKPVPINPTQIQKGNLGRSIVALAGIAANLGLALFSLIALSIILQAGLWDANNYAVKFFAFLAIVNIALFVFNLLPVPPLDGSRIWESFAPVAYRRIAPLIEQGGFLILIFLVFFTNIIGFLISLGIYLISAPFGLNLFQLVGF